MLDCLVIGGGHCGLVCGYLLARAGVSYRVVDASTRAGDVWRHRPENLRLFTSRQFCRLADMPMYGDPNGFPTGNEFADHVERFANDKAIVASFGTRVSRLSRSENCFIAEFEDGSILHSKTVINATGSNQIPIVPAFAQKLSPTIRQIVASDYRNAADLPAGSTVAVVGDGASGRQIAYELSTEHHVYIARGRMRKLVPNVVFGRDVFWWLDKLGLLFAGGNTLIAKIIKKRDPIPVASANDQQLSLRGVILKSRAVDAHDDHLIFFDGSRERVDAIVWCVGYQENLGWINLPMIGHGISLNNNEGRTPEDGFFVVGRKWLTCRASELILGTENDAEKVVSYVLENIQKISQSTDNIGKKECHQCLKI